jgi:hypothetical protein
VRILVGASAIWGVISAALSYGTMRSARFVFVLRRGSPSSFPRFSSVPVPLAALASLLGLGVIIVWLLWQERVTENVWAQGNVIKTTPGWAVGWWFIPVANLWMPAVALYRVARASIGSRDGSVGLLVGAWWAAYVASRVVFLAIGAAVAMGSVIRAIGDVPTKPSEVLVLDLTRTFHQIAPWSLAASLMALPAAALAIAMVSRIDQAQGALGPPIPPRPDLSF